MTARSDDLRRLLSFALADRRRDNGPAFDRLAVRRRPNDNRHDVVLLVDGGYPTEEAGAACSHWQRVLDRVLDDLSTAEGSRC